MKSWFVNLSAVVLLGTLLFSFVETSRAQTDTEPAIGPYTEIQIPFEDLPELNENLAFHPVIDQYETGATLQIMYVLEDPRDVPLARYAYYDEDIGVISPTNWPAQSESPEYLEGLEEMLSYNPKTINVYVRSQAPVDRSVPDPLFGDPVVNLQNPNRPALLVYFAGYAGRPFPCAVPEYEDGTEPYQLPSEIPGGSGVGDGAGSDSDGGGGGGDGLHDPIQDPRFSDGQEGGQEGQPSQQCQGPASPP